MTVLQQERYVDYVLNRLAVLTELPTTGYLAGGAVANLIWEAAKNIPAVINDVDVFLLKELVAIDIAKPFYDEFTIGEVESVYSSYQDAYKTVIYKEEVNNFIRVTKSEREGILNLVSYQSNHDEIGILLRSFDLNCTMVAIDLATRKLHMEPSFEVFLETGEVKIINYNTPAHSMLRALRKASELSVVYDLKSQLPFIKYVLSKYHRTTRLRFGEKLKLLYESHGQLLSNHFKLEKFEKSIYHKVQLWGIRPHSDLRFGTDPRPTCDIENITYFNYFVNKIHKNGVQKFIWDNLMISWMRYERQTGKSYLEDINVNELSEKEVNKIKRFGKAVPQMYQHAFTLIPLLELLKIVDWVDDISETCTDQLNLSSLRYLSAPLQVANKIELEELLLFLRIKHRRLIDELKA